MKASILTAAFLSCIIVVSLVPVAMAGTLDLGFDTVYDEGDAVPEGTSPWLTAQFEDVDAAVDFVRLTLFTTNLVGNEFVADWYFNFDPNLPLSSLQFNHTSAATVSFAAKKNEFSAGPDGLYDINIVFQGDAKKDMIYPLSFDISLDNGNPLYSSAFNFTSVPGDKGPFWAAAHIQSIDNGDGSAWVGAHVVPEPLSAALFILGGAGLAFARRRKQA